MYQYFNIFIALFDAAERLNTRVCALLIGVHGPHFIEGYLASSLTNLYFILYFEKGSLLFSHYGLKSS